MEASLVQKASNYDDHTTSAGRQTTEALRKRPYPFKKKNESSVGRRLYPVHIVQYIEPSVY